MKRTLFGITLWTILLAILIPGPALAGDTCQLATTLSEIRSQTDFLDTSRAFEVDEQILFYRLPVSPAAGTRVEVQFVRGERPVLIEELTLRPEDLSLDTQRLRTPTRNPSDSRPAVVELLAAAPEDRARILQFADTDSLTAHIFLDGKLLETLALQDLIQRSESVKSQDDLVPRSISPRVVQSPSIGSLQTLSAAASTCEDNCWVQHDFCIDQCVFMPNSGPCFDSCDAARDECLMDCAGTCTPSTTTSTDVVQVSQTVVGPVECHEHPFFGKDLYVWVKKRFKRTVTTTTTNADCSQTVTTDVTYFDIFCWQFYQFSPGCFEFFPTLNFC